MEELQLIFVPGPGIGHIVSAIEVGKLIVNEDSRLSITYLLINDPAVREYTNSRPINHPRLRLINLPELEKASSDSRTKSKLPQVNLPELEEASSDSQTESKLPQVNHPEFEEASSDSQKESKLPQVKEASSDSQTESKLPQIQAAVHVTRQKSLIREAVVGITGTATEARVVGFVVDMLCLTMTEVADEFSIPTYLYFTSGASFLSFTMFMQRLTDEHHADITEFRDSNEKLPVPGFVNPVPATVTPSILLDRDGGSAIVMSSARLIRKTRGIFINTFQELEPNIIQSLSIDDQLPPVYAVGPLLSFQTPPESEFSDVIEFLDQQPRKSVVFLCFGSLGSFSAAQIKQQAAALESTGRRFLWSLRRGKQSDFSVLPEGFLERTKGVGRVIGWAPQAAVLAHPAVGGFVSHCGWNSILESVSCGVPMAAWPLYAEQQINAFQMVEEVGVAVEARVDYREESGVVVGAEEIAAAIEGMMEGGKGVRERAEEMREKSSGAVVDGGSSRMFLARLVRDILDNASA